MIALTERLEARGSFVAVSRKNWSSVRVYLRARLPPPPEHRGELGNAIGATVLGRALRRKVACADPRLMIGVGAGIGSTETLRTATQDTAASMDLGSINGAPHKTSVVFTLGDGISN